LDVSDNKQLWGEQYQRSVSDLLALQRDIAREIASNLRPKLTGQGQFTKSTTDNAEAYQLYLHGRYFFHKFTPVDHKRAVEYFDQALAKDPNYARAYSGLADTLGASAVNSWIVPMEGYPKAMAAAQKAVALDDNLAEAHATLGAITMFYRLDWEKAEQEYKRAIELNPNHTDTYEIYSYLLSATGRLNEAIDVINRGVALDPLSLPILDDNAQAYYWARRYDEALERYRRSIEIDSAHPGVYVGVGVVYEQKGMYKEAIEAFQKAIDSTERTSSLLGLLGHAYAVSGNKAQGLKILDELKQMEKEKYVSPYDLAVIYTGLGEKDQAIEQLSRAYDQRAGWVIMLKTEPMFDPLRSDLRFAALLRRLDQK
jgi:tetratricopeptide (TPR) repeat protein